MNNATLELLAAATAAQLADIHNAVAEKPVKKFRTKADAVERTAIALDAADKSIIIRDEAFHVIDAPSEEPAEPKKPRSPFAMDDAINFNLSTDDEGKFKNPKRAGSQSHARFALYETCETVGEYCEAAAKLEEDKGNPPYYYLRDIHWDCQRGFISVGDPE